MAIYHYSGSVITRSKKGAMAKASGARGSTKGDQRVAVSSVVAAAAYRAGEDLVLRWEKNPFARYMLAADPEQAFPVDEADKSIEIMTKTEIRFDYSRKTDVAYKEIFAPAGAQEWVYNREVLWNKVENAEKRVDSMLGRHIDAALPKELGLDECKKLVKEFVETNFVSKGMVVDVAIHDFKSHNPHVHIMLTTRELGGDGFAAKKCAAWTVEFASGKGKVLVNSGPLEQERESWAKFCNKALEEAGRQERIDHRSYKDQGIDKVPTFHIGKNAWYLEKTGRATELMSRFKDIVLHNAAIEKLREFQKAMQAKPLYKLVTLQKAREVMSWFFDKKQELAYPKPPPEKDR